MRVGAIMIRAPEPITIDPHFSPAFYAELWGISVSTVVRWFQDEPGVLKLQTAFGTGAAGVWSFGSHIPSRCACMRSGPRGR